LAPTWTTVALAHQALDPQACRLLVPDSVELADAMPVRWQQGAEASGWRWEVPERLLGDLREILPCYCSRGAVGYQFGLEYEAEPEAGVHTAWLDPVGTMPASLAAPRPAPGPVVRTETDLLRIAGPLRRATVRLVVAGDPAAIQSAPALAAVSVRHAAGAGPAPRAPARPAPRAQRLLVQVPARSQMRLDPALANRVCSPTCLSMLLQHYGRQVDVYRVIEAVHHAPTGLYGVWPANIQAAARHGLIGLLLHFPDLDSLEWLLCRGCPVIASIRFEAGELPGAPIARSSGHLIVLCGVDGSRVIANDPAAPDDHSVRRAYCRRDLERVWLERAAVGYVLVPAERLRASADRHRVA